MDKRYRDFAEKGELRERGAERKSSDLAMEALQISIVSSRHLASNSQSPCASRSLCHGSNCGRKSSSISSSWLGSSNLKSLSSRNLFAVRH